MQGRNGCQKCQLCVDLGKEITNPIETLFMFTENRYTFHWQHSDHFNTRLTEKFPHYPALGISGHQNSRHRHFPCVILPTGFTLYYRLSHLEDH